MDMIISHVKLQDGEFSIQSNENHSLGVATLSERFASNFGFGAFGHVMGMLHDIGKEQSLFQTRIRRASGMEEGAVPRAPHAFVGALIAKRLYPSSWPFASWAMMCHHAGLYDQGKFELEMEYECPDEITDEIVSHYDKEHYGL